jgi:hypothetical protein
MKWHGQSLSLPWFRRFGDRTVPDAVVELNSTICVLGREVRVPITYAREGVYYVFEAPSYKVKVARGTRTVAWKEFSDKLTLAVEERLKARF